MTWIAPTIIRGRVEWLDECQATIKTVESIQHRNRHGGKHSCVRRAKVDFRGTLLCLMHAQIAALEELAGVSPLSETDG